MRYPIVQQHDATDCGPAVLAMAAAHHGRRVSIAKLRELAGTDRQGTNLAGLATAAEQGGVQGKAVGATRGTLEQMPLSALPHLRGSKPAPFFAHFYKSPRKQHL